VAFHKITRVSQWSRIRIPAEARNVSPKTLGQVWDAPSLLWVPVLFPGGVKQPGRYVNISPPCIAEVKNEWSCTSLGVDRDVSIITAV